MIGKEVLPDFQKFLLANKLASEKYTPFLALWVSKFLVFRNRRGEQDINVTVSEFLDFLRSKEDIQDWQIRQAENALRLYLHHFKGHTAPQPRSGGKKFEVRLSETPLLISEMKRLIRLKHLAYNTELAYLDWIERFFAYVQENSGESGSMVLTHDAVQNFLSHLAIQKRISSSTQNQALCALVFLYRDVLGRDLGDISGMVWAKRGKKLPVVLSVNEIKMLFTELSGTALLIAQLLYGSGLRIKELCRLRVLDVDFEASLIVVRSGKGDKDRSTILSDAVKKDLRLHLSKVKALHDKDLGTGHGEVFMPSALERKYPNAAKEWKWQYIFPSANLSIDPRSGKTRRHHISEKSIQRPVAAAAKKAGIMKHATVHTLRHSFATHLLMKGVNIREIQALLGHKSIETTMIYTHVLRDFQRVPMSPLDDLLKSEE